MSSPGAGAPIKSAPARQAIAADFARAPADAGPLTRSRMGATEAWLRDAPGGAYAVQVMLLAPGNKRELEAFLERTDKLTGLNDIYLYQTRVKGQSEPVVAVVFGGYATRDEAREAVARFPEELRAHLPYLRTVDGIRREVAERDPRADHAG
jgi:septal ring-binding cell division protein DamX